MFGERERFVGRERELDALNAALEGAASGRFRLALVVGEPGIGKTRIADQLADTAADRGFAVSWGRCWEAGEAPAFWPWSQALNPLASGPGIETAAAEVLGARSGLLGQVVTALREPASRIDHASLPDSARLELFSEVVEFLTLASTKQPLLLVLDDIHAADLSSLLLLQFVARGLRRANLAVVACYRDVEAHVRPEINATIAAIEREGIKLQLPRLSRDEALALIAAIGGSASDELADAVYAKTQGNPLFVGELSEWLRAEGGFDAERPPSHLPIPFGVKEAIRQRLAALSAESRELLAIASVFGRELDPLVLAAVSGREIDSVRSLLADAEARGAVASTGAGYRFRHILIREALYADLGEPERVDLHAEVAGHLRELAATDPNMPLATLVGHFLAAAPKLGFERAVEVAIAAADQSVQKLAFEDAIALLRDVLEAVESSHGLGGLRAELMIALARVQMQSGQLEEGRALGVQALELARRIEAGDLFAEAVLAFGDNLKVATVDLRLVDLLEEALERVGDRSAVLRARVAARLAAARVPNWTVRTDHALARESIEIGRTAEPADRLEIFYWAMSALMDYDDPWSRAEINLETERLAGQLGVKHRVLRARARLVIDYLEQGDARRAWAMVERYAEIAAELDQPRFSWLSEAFEALRAALEGRFGDADQAMDRAVSIAAEIGGAGPLVLQRFGLAMAREDDDAIRAAAAEVESLTWFTGDFNPLPLFAATGLLRIGDLDAASALLAAVDFDRWLAISDRAISQPIAEYAALIGDRDLARRCYDLLLPEEHRTGVWGLAGLACDLVVSRFLGLLAATLGDHAAAERHFHAATTQLRSMRARPGLARTLYDHGRYLSGREAAAEQARGAELLASSRAIAEELGMSGLLARIESVSAPPVESAAGAALVPEVAPFEIALDGDLWRIRCAEGEFHFKNTRGMRLLHTLSSSPGQEFHVLDLGETRGDTREVAGDAGEHLDEQAKAAYRARVTDLREQLEEAESFSDIARAERIRSELDMLMAELSRAFGLGGRERRAGAAAERARSAVQRRIKDAIRRIGEHAPKLAEHLEWAVKTGTFCVYRLDSGS